MAPNPRRIHARLQELYDRIPSGFCKGLCSDSCGIVHPSTSVAEIDRVKRESSLDLGGCEYGGLCPALQDGRCTVYDIRPMVCRLYGVVENLKCPYGCVPPGGWWPVDVGLALLVESLEVGGMAPGQKDIAKAEIKALFDDPLARQKILRAANSVPPLISLAGRSHPPSILELHRERT